MGQISWAIMLCMFERQLFLSTFSTMRSISFALRIHQIVSPIFNSESTNFFNKFIMIFQIFFKWQTEKKPCLFSFSIAHTEKNSQKKLVKISDEFVKR